LGPHPRRRGVRGRAERQLGINKSRGEKCAAQKQTGRRTDPLTLLGNEMARSERRPRGGWGAEIRSLSVGPGREATMIIIRFFGAWQCLNLGGTVIYISQCYTSCNP